MHFDKLRLVGFKSFVEPTELAIHPGLTGVVGPNGCGKSNLVEALRWVMGETSAKRMRGGEMDDVIFGGTATRPSRNFAEVALHIDNTQRKAPPAFNADDELQVRRRIERGMGSDYAVNGKSTRARDVQMLFADGASGASSPALVSQGKIAAIVNAKPTERRMILEEAAGVAGLRTRRHEAELKLRAAEGNLTRVDDVVGALSVQLEALKKQARQAARYRVISDHIRRAEALVLHKQYSNAAERLSGLQEAMTALDARHALVTAAVAEATTHEVNAASALPELRRTEAVQSAGLQRLVIARENLAQDEAKLQAQISAARDQATQIATDTDYEQTQAAESAAMLASGADEIEALNAAMLAAATLEAEAATHDAAARGLADLAQHEYDGVVQECAAIDAQRRGLQQQIDRAMARVQQLAGQLHQYQTDHDALYAQLKNDQALHDSNTALAAALAARDDADQMVTVRDIARDEKIVATTHARSAADQARMALQTVQAEMQALENVLRSAAGDHPAVLDKIVVDSGYETALAAALAEGLNAALDENAPMRWHELPALFANNGHPDWPHDVTPLAHFVKAPSALNRAIHFIGLVDDESIGQMRATQLLPGQILVTKQGALWRWDGLTISASAPTATAMRLTQRNRLVDVQAQLPALQQAHNDAADALHTASHAVQQAEQQAREARQILQQAQRDADAARAAHNNVVQATAAASARLIALEQTIERATVDKQSAESELAAAHNDMRTAPDAAILAAMLDESRLQMVHLRSRANDARMMAERLQREGADRAQRLIQVQNQQSQWQQRQQRAAARVDELAQRAIHIAAQIAELENEPQKFIAQKNALAAQIETAESALKQASDALAVGETAQRQAAAALKMAEADYQAVREERIRTETGMQAAHEAMQTVTERTQTSLAMAPDSLQAGFDITPAEMEPDAERLQQRYDRLIKERDTMGPVNLRADVESQELQTQMDHLTHERDELILAIAKLRGGIGHLNREARERLLAAFETVDRNFQNLFVRLFNGGTAKLQMVDSDDPLEAGLEIIASPPGKKLQNLSLLSGGEQALTALSLIFAMFKSNPSPICVLDEVDAPLDDANVDRFCSLLEDIAQENATRFLVITHHRLTMARMHRLFGVTMMEQGVSKLVSVDLQRAEQMVEQMAA